MNEHLDNSLSNWFETIRLNLPDLPFLDTERSESLRPELIKRLLSLLLTDDERAVLFGLPKGCRIREGAKILYQHNLRIGEYCWIGENAILDASGGLEIGSHTSIGPSTYIWTHTSHFANLARNNIIGSDLIERRSTRIGSGCFIAGPTVVWPGVSIGDNVVIRAFTIVDRDVPSNSLVSNKGITENVFTEGMIQRWIEVSKRRRESAERQM